MAGAFRLLAFGPGHYGLGLLARTLGRVDDAGRRVTWSAALELSAKMGPASLPIVGSLALAEALVERQGEGDQDRALQLLNDAMDAARDMGSAHFVERALATKLEVQGIDVSQTHRSIYSVAHSVQTGRPDFGKHAAADGTVTLMFSDMQGFTSMTERLGDEAAHRVIQTHNRILREQVAAHEGREVDSQGDGFLLAFPSARERCARRGGDAARLRRLSRAGLRRADSYPDRPPHRSGDPGRRQVLRTHGDPGLSHRRPGPGRRDSGLRGRAGCRRRRLPPR